MVLLPMAAASIRLGGWARTIRGVERLTGNRRFVTGASADPAAIARAVRIAATYGPCRAACLPRAAVLWGLARSYGFNAIIRIGVRRCGERLDAHAWVEVDRTPLDDLDTTKAYVPFHTASDATPDGEALVRS
jgi:hypothetical protein